MLKTDFPIIINGQEFAPFGQWNVTYNDTVTTHETEAGTQEDIILRKGRRSIAVSTTCLADTASKLAQLEEEPALSVTFYDIKTKGSVTINARVAAGSMSISLKPKSSNLATTNGVYTVSFTLEEF
jgi:hypothetical protein